MKVKPVILITAAISVALTMTGCRETVSTATPVQPPSVPVATVSVRPVTPFFEFTGSTLF